MEGRHLRLTVEGGRYSVGEGAGNCVGEGGRYCVGEGGRYFVRVWGLEERTALGGGYMEGESSSHPDVILYCPS